MEATLEAPAQTERINSVPTEDRSLEGLGKMLSKGLKTEPIEEKKPVAQTVVDNITKDLVGKGAEEVQVEVAPITDAQEEVVTAPAVAEAPASAPKVEVEVKAEKNFWEEEEAPVSDEKKEQIKANNIKDLELKAKEYEELSNEKFINAYLSAKKAGKDVNTFLDEIKGTDPNKLTPAQLYEIDLKSEGLTEEQIGEEMESFNALSPFAQIKQTKETKAKLVKEQENRLGQYATDNQVNQRKLMEIGTKALKEKENYLESQKGKRVMGLEMTPTLLSEINDYYENFNITRDDGSIDVPRIMQIGLLEKKSKLMLQNAYAKGKTDAELEFYKTHARPSKDNGIAVVPEVKNKSQQSETQKNLAEFDRLTQIRGRGSRVS